MSEDRGDDSGSPGAAQYHHAGLCASCAHSKVVTSSRGSVFYLCQLSSTDARFPRYPTLPVLSCPGYEVAPLSGSSS